MNTLRQNKTIILLSIKLIFTINYLFASDENISAGARSAGMSNASVAHVDIWSIYNNQAGLGYIDNIILAAYNKSYSGIKLGTKALLFSVPTSGGTFGISFSDVGYKDFHIQKIGIGLGKKLSEKLSSGVQLDYLRLAQPYGYGTDGVFTFELGILTKPAENLNIGFHAYNPVLAKYSTQDEENLETIYRGGLEYSFSDDALIALEIEKTLNQEARYKIGCDYGLYENLDLLLGVISNPLEYSFGLGFGLQNAQAGAAFSFQDILGIVAHLSFSYAF